MSLILKKKCCCVHGCYRLALRCPCSPAGPGIAIKCSDILAHPGKSAIIFFKFQGVCYSVSINSPTVDPNSTDPPLVIGNLLDSLYEDCAECCAPAQCWNVCTICPCSGDGEVVYLPFNCNGPPNSGYFRDTATGKCYSVGGVVTSLPPGAVVLVSVQAVASCEACCGCPTDCTPCPTSYTLIVPAFTMELQGGGGTCFAPVPQKSWAISKGGFGPCIWNGYSPFFDVLATCPDFQLPLTVREFGTLGCENAVENPLMRKWTIVASIGPDGVGTGTAKYQSVIPATPISCPPFSDFNKVSGTSWMPSTVSLA